MEVAGRKSNLDTNCQGSNEDDDDFYCDPCENEGERQPAEGFCVDCQEYLCSSCFKIHRRPSLWRHHVLLDKYAMPKTKTKEQLNYECTEPCVQHSTKILEYYCQTHDQLGCPVCVTGNHRTCNDVDYIPHIAGQYKESSEINEIFNSLESLQEKTDEYISTPNDDKLKVAAYEKNAKARVLQLRDEFNSICDRLEEDIDTIKESDETKIESCIKTYEDISKKIKTRVAVMEKKRTEMKVSQLFTEAKLSKLSVDELTKEMASARDNAKIRHYEIDFNVEELSEGLKLSFHDNRIEAVRSELKHHSPSNSQNKLARNSKRRDTTVEDDPEAKGSNISALLDDIMKLQSNKTANAPGQSENGSKRNVKGPTLTSFEYSPGLSYSDVRNTQDTKGILKYDREFLLQFRTCAYALRKPEHLLDDPDIILDTPNEASSNDIQNDFNSKYAWTATARKKQSKSKVSSSELGASELSTPSKSNADLREQSPVNVSQPQQTLGHVIRPATSSQQNMYAMPPPLLPYHVPLTYPQSSAAQLTYPGLQNVMNPNMQGMPYPLPPGIPYSPQGPPQIPRPSFTPFGFEQQFMGIHANDDQQSQKVRPSNRNTSAEISKVGAQLNDFILKDKKDNEMVIEWIDSNVDVSTRKQPRFIRALMTVICNSAIKGNKGHEKLEPKEISARNDLIQRYINHESELELQALYAVQAFITHLGHPKGILRGLFDTLYDEDLIGEDAFFQWEGSKDEPEGKEECLKQTIQFLTWLKEEDEDS
ncbi:uncharacterized protein LOC123537351 [Mercenaria mercenaria]|uniref:uncharacterized protein LOC123537351 n=1 Tax=Mercenaria mercenaria TaxID=6596 RepID=UPI00234E6076|nr:uncharacterized protein LOC123537351 [Mercenaria mercenaria]